MINLNSLTKNIKDGFKAPTGDSNRETPTKGALRFNTETGKPEIYAKGRGWRRASVSEISAIYTHDNLVAFYDASNADTTGDTVEDITSNLNGVNNGATVETTSPANYSFSSGDYIQVSDDNLLDPVNITVLTWAYKSDWGESSPVSQRLISKYPNTGSSGWLQYLTGDSGLFKNVIYVGGTRYEANINATSISSGWHQVVFTYDGSSFKFYIDASLEQTNSNMSGDLSSNSTDLFIGNQQNSSNSPVNNDSGRYFNGKVAIVKIYDSALSEADITSEFNYHKSTFGL